MFKVIYDCPWLSRFCCVELITADISHIVDHLSPSSEVSELSPFETSEVSELSPFGTSEDGDSCEEGHDMMAKCQQYTIHENNHNFYIAGVLTNYRPMW